MALRSIKATVASSTVTSSQLSSLLLHCLFTNPWAWVDLNHRPHAYQACALTNWATDPKLLQLRSTLRVLLSSLRIPASLESQPCAPAPGARKEKALLFLFLLTQLSYRPLILLRPSSFVLFLCWLVVSGTHAPTSAFRSSTTSRLELKQNTWPANPVYSA